MEKANSVERLVHKIDIDKIYKIVIFGNSGVGKTAMTCRLKDRKFKESTKRTIGVEFVVKKFVVDNVEITLQIWDFSGEKRFGMLLPMYLKGSDGGIFVFDITSRPTIDSIDRWINFVREKTSKDFPIIIVGSKSDLDFCRTISKSEGIDKSKIYSSVYMECSSKNGDNIDEVFKAIVRKVTYKEDDCLVVIVN